ncbi:MAG: CRISPR system precrRNA processing endoribonuclease RAMP protein Cas6 [Thiotrichales bacterium]
MDIYLPVSSYRFVVRAVDAIYFHQYSGSAWRGAFGHALKAASCVTGQSSCHQCLLQQGCVYAYLFETPVPKDTKRMRLYPSAPHPFVISPPATFRQADAGEQLELRITVVGKANQHLPYIVYAFQQAGSKGLGRQNSRFEIEDILQENVPGQGNWASIYDRTQLNAQEPAMPMLPPVPQDFSIEFLTPTRLTVNNARLTDKNFELSAVLGNLIRRISMLSYFHTDHAITLDFKALAAQSKSIPWTEQDIQWQDWTRYSSRQKSSVQMGGITGSITLQGDQIEPFWPALWLGQWLNLGKATIMGLGQYRISSNALQNNLDAAA